MCTLTAIVGPHCAYQSRSDLTLLFVSRNVCFGRLLSLSTCIRNLAVPRAHSIMHAIQATSCFSHIIIHARHIHIASYAPANITYSQQRLVLEARSRSLIVSLMRCFIGSRILPRNSEYFFYVRYWFMAMRFIVLLTTAHSPVLSELTWKSVSEGESTAIYIQRVSDKETCIRYRFHCIVWANVRWTNNIATGWAFGNGCDAAWQFNYVCYVDKWAEKWKEDDRLQCITMVNRCDYMLRTHD